MFGVVFLLLFLGLPLKSEAESIDAEIQRHVRAATFEVVQLKPTEDPLIYEKPLPLELIPYQQRIDKYRSIGTAFAIGNNEFITAAHVLALGLSTLYGPLMLRNADGEVYAIDKVLRYSQAQDFVVFSLQAKPRGFEILTIGDPPSLNDPVFSVGNALGQGVVIRDGVFTSETPEENEGRWRWLRFSAAASPGNSGGPLVDKRGSVVGVVLRKSAQENLNYAVPIKLVIESSDRQAVIDSRNPFRLSIMDTSEVVETHDRIALPMLLPSFINELRAIKEASIERSDAQLLTHNQDRLFPQSDTSATLLNETFASPFPRRIHEGSDHIWVASLPQIQTFQLEHNGFVQMGGGVFRLHAPDDVRLTAIYGDSKLFMDLLLRGAYSLHRKVGTDTVKVTSLGKAQQEFLYTDHYGRVWQGKAWPIPFDDLYVVVMNLPTPEGCVSLVATGPSSVMKIMVRQQELLLDYVFVTFEASLERWNEYLSLKSVHPRTFNALTLTVEPEKKLDFNSDRFKLSVTPEQQSLAKDSVLSLNFSFQRDGHDVVWDVGGLSVTSNGEGSGSSMEIQRIERPEPSLPTKFQTIWNQLNENLFPYNREAIVANSRTKISGSVTNSAVAKDAAHVKYLLSVSANGEQQTKAMQERFIALNDKVKIVEH